MSWDLFVVRMRGYVNTRIRLAEANRCMSYGIMSYDHESYPIYSAMTLILELTTPSISHSLTSADSSKTPVLHPFP